MPRNKIIKNILRGGNEDIPGAEDSLNQASEMMKNPTVLIIAGISLIIVIIIIVVIVKSVKQKKNAPFLIGDPVDGTNPQMIDASEIPISTSHEYSMNFWIFVRDWSYDYGKPKCVLYRGDANCNHASPMVFLYPRTNSLMVRFSTEANRNQSINPFKCPQHNLYDPIHACDVTNIPIQRWVQVTVVLWNTTTDVYINGKIARSCTHPSIPLNMSQANIYVAQGGGFKGYISKLQYFNYAIDALKSYQLYMKGPIPKKFLGLKVKGLCGGSSSSQSTPSSSSIPNPSSFTYSDPGTCS